MESQKNNQVGFPFYLPKASVRLLFGGHGNLSAKQADIKLTK
jgi:hypothetical protein